MTYSSSNLSPEELKKWHFGLKQADDNNVFCHCRQCDREWVDSSDEVACVCGSKNVETISCWQFPDG